MRKRNSNVNCSNRRSRIEKDVPRGYRVRGTASGVGVLVVSRAVGYVDICTLHIADFGIVLTLRDCIL